MNNIRIEMKPDDLIAMRLYDERDEKTIALLDLETLLSWDNRLEGMIAWLEGVKAAYRYHLIHTEAAPVPAAVIASKLPES